MPPTKVRLPEVPNPVVDLRNKLAYSQDVFAYKLGITRMALLRMEQGCLPEPSIRLLPYVLGQSHSVNLPNLPNRPVGVLPPSRFPSTTHDEHTAAWQQFLKKYFEFQHLKRQENFGILDPGMTEAELLEAADASQHPLTFWRESTQPTPTNTNLAVGLCVHLATLHTFEFGNKLPHYVPSSFFTAVIDAGYSSDLMQSFVKAYGVYRGVI